MIMALPILAFGQQRDSVFYKNKRFEFGINGMPSMAYRELNFSTINQYVAQKRNSTEIPKFGYSAGIDTRTRINNNFSIEINANFSDLGEQTKTIPLSWSTPTSDLPVSTKANFHFYYFAFPVKVDYYLSSKKLKGLQSKKLRYFVSLGVSADIFFERNTVMTVNYPNSSSYKSKSTELLEYNQASISLLVSAGIQYQCTRWLSITVEPTYHQFLSSITPVKGALEYPYAIGLNVGFWFSFKARH
jgi:hypothetical protein